MAMKKYSAYKDSGIEWIGEIPQGWEVNRIKFLFSFGRGLNITKADLVEKGLPVISYGQIHSKLNTGTSINETLLRYIPSEIAEGQKECKVKIGDFIFADTSEDKEGCGNCVYVDKEGIYAGYHSLVLNGKKRDNKYFAYLFKSEDWRSQIRSKVSGVKVFSITQSIMSNCSVVLPSLAEQQAIAAYLDHKVGQIDSAVSGINAQIADLRAYRQSVISEAVTKGLNPDAPMKDSGIEWIGQIPEGWEVIKLKHSLDSHAGGTWGAEPQNNEGDVICVRVADFDDKNGVVSRNKLTYRNYTSKELSTKTLSTRDLLLEKSGGGEKTPVGRVIRFNLDELATCSNFIERLTVKNGFCSDFIYYFFFSMYSKGINRKHFSQTTGIQNLNVSSYLDESFTLPPLAEQQAIAAYLDEKTAKIDASIKALEAQVADLQALKLSTISEAVTGKVDVRDWKPSDN